MARSCWGSEDEGCLCAARAPSQRTPPPLRPRRPHNPPILPPLQLATFLLLRATLAPGLMVAVARLMGFTGDLAVALVILSILPVAQTAFVVCKQYETGVHAVTAAMVASLLLMLPQLMGTLALLERWGVFA